MNMRDPNLPIVTPECPGPEAFHDPEKATERLVELYTLASDFLCERFSEGVGGAQARQQIPGVLSRNPGLDQRPSLRSTVG